MDVLILRRGDYICAYTLSLSLTVSFSLSHCLSLTLFISHPHGLLNSVSLTMSATQPVLRMPRVNRACDSVFQQSSFMDDEVSETVSDAVSETGKE